MRCLLVPDCRCAVYSRCEVRFLSSSVSGMPDLIPDVAPVRRTAPFSTLNASKPRDGFMSENRLNIKAHSLELELTGEADYVVEAYEAIRGVVIRRFEETIDEIEAEDERAREKRKSAKKGQNIRHDDSISANTTNPLFRIDSLKQHVAAGRELTTYHLQFVVCTELYNRIAALPRDEFDDSIFGKSIKAEAITKVYLDESAAGGLRDRIEFGKTLWRELTTAGKAAIHGDSS